MWEMANRLILVIFNWVDQVISSRMLNSQFSTCWKLLSARLSNISFLLQISWFGPFGGQLCVRFWWISLWVPLAILTRVLFVLVCHCQLIFWIFFFFWGWKHWKEILRVYKPKKFKQINHFYSVFGIWFSNSMSSYLFHLIKHLANDVPCNPSI